MQLCHCSGNAIIDSLEMSGYDCISRKEATVYLSLLYFILALPTSRFQLSVEINPLELKPLAYSSVPDMQTPKLRQKVINDD